jgi:VIT1/CCC1 family predicted Fe2+/Mn2+ transporter
MNDIGGGEHHFSERIGWLRAAVLGANDGILSTASLMVGVASANTGRPAVLLAGVAGLAAGAMSMAAGEYVSVSSQSDTEKADLEREKEELEKSPEKELEELRGIYVKRGLDRDLALQVAQQLTAHDALGTHMRDELGLSEIHTARPVQAAFASAASFAIGGALPLVLAIVVAPRLIIYAIPVGSLLFLAFLGAASASAGGSHRGHAAFRVTFWGALAMALTALVGRLFGTAL